MGRTEREKMAAGAWYSCIDPELESFRARAREAVHEHNTMPPDRRGTIAPKLQKLLAEVGAGVYLEAPFHCDLRLQHLPGRSASTSTPAA